MTAALEMLISILLSYAQLVQGQVVVEQVEGLVDPDFPVNRFVLLCAQIDYLNNADIRLFLEGVLLIFLYCPRKYYNKLNSKAKVVVKY